jgi:MFS transporter, DHA1 family, multidrug resistance protein
VNQLGFGLITPVLPAYARSFGLGSGAVGLVIGTYGLARFFANVPAGHVAERYGRRTVLIAGTAITSLASALIATSTSLPQLIAYRLLAGLGAATVLTGGQIMVGDMSTPQNRGRMMSIYQGFFLIGVGLGPTPGGLLADAFGLRAPFVAYAIFSAVACGFALLIITETKPKETATVASASGGATSAGEDDTNLWRVVFSAPFLLVGLVSFVQFWARTGALFTVIPLLGKDRIGLSPSQIGFAMTIPNILNIATLYHAGSLSDRFGRKWVIVPATMVSGLSVALWAVGNSYAVFLLSAAIWGLGSGISGPSPAAYVADISPPALRGRLFGLYRSVADSGYIVGPLLLGWMAGVTGYTFPLLLTAAMFLGSGLLFALFAPERYRRESAPELEPARSTNR